MAHRYGLLNVFYISSLPWLCSKCYNDSLTQVTLMSTIFWVTSMIYPVLIFHWCRISKWSANFQNFIEKQRRLSGAIRWRDRTCRNREVTRNLSQPENSSFQLAISLRQEQDRGIRREMTPVEYHFLLFKNPSNMPVTYFLDSCISTVCHHPFYHPGVYSSRFVHIDWDKSGKHKAEFGGNAGGLDHQKFGGSENVVLL